MDVVDRATRSRMMSGIKGTDTKPEMQIRSMLHRAGYRFRLHARRLPGRPDLVLPKYRAVIFVHGCFWHGHGCHLFKWPTTRKEFWTEKITSNRIRDQGHAEELRLQGWRTLVIWECSLKGKARLSESELLARIRAWLESREVSLEISGEDVAAS